MNSIWTKTCALPPLSKVPLPDRAHTIVIGGGMAGILTAWLLQKAGEEVLVLEASRIGSGQTCRTTAKITSAHGLCYAPLSRALGPKAASLFAHANQEAIEVYRHMIAENQIPCHFENLSACLYSCRSDAALDLEAKAAARFGLPVRLSDRSKLPFSVKAALYIDGQAQFHPLEFLYSLAKELTVCENTPVLTVKGHTIVTREKSILADRIIFACHYPFLRLAGLYFPRMHQERSYVLAASASFLPNCMYYGVDPSSPSLRSFEDLLLLGGSGHRTGETPQSDCYRALRRTGLELGLLAPRTAASGTAAPAMAEAARWSAQDCMTLDGLPYIGRFSRFHPDWYITTGFGKWGMTGSMAGALLLRDLLTGRENPYTSLFSPSRFHPDASLPSLKKEGSHAVRSLAAHLESAPPFSIAAKENARPRLPSMEPVPGEGRIVTRHGKKVGVYLEESGRPHFVSPYCPHLGCQLTWNPSEKTWDCPCHGSRFTYDGKLLDSPADRDLPHRFSSSASRQAKSPGSQKPE